MDEKISAYEAYKKLRKEMPVFTSEEREKLMKDMAEKRARKEKEERDPEAMKEMLDALYGGEDGSRGKKEMKCPCGKPMSACTHKIGKELNKVLGMLGHTSKEEILARGVGTINDMRSMLHEYGSAETSDDGSGRGWDDLEDM